MASSQQSSFGVAAGVLDGDVGGVGDEGRKELVVMKSGQRWKESLCGTP